MIVNINYLLCARKDIIPVQHHVHIIRLGVAWRLLEQILEDLAIALSDEGRRDGDVSQVPA